MQEANSQEPIKYIDVWNEFSSLFTLQRVTAICLRFINNCRRSISNQFIPQFKTESTTMNEMKVALNSLIRGVQQSDTCLANDIQLLSKSKQLSKQSCIKNLNPYIDTSNILRVGGRLQLSNMNNNKKHPIILPSNHKLTELIIKEVHIRYLHAGQQLMLGILSNQYWIIRAKNAVRKCIRNCTVCIRYRAEPQKQQMGNLPAYRITPSRPFTNTGTDFAGPFMVRTWHGRSAKIVKSYVVLFVCMATKAIHIELVSDLTTNNFMAALHRFISRRGSCSNIYSDNGRTYLGAARKLEELQKFLQNNYQSITKELQKHEITWHFIPAFTPHFGGIWESAVKSMKHHLKRIIGETILTYEQFTTLLCQIEACLNSRPIAPTTQDVDDLEPLTPGHFLVQGPILLPAQEQYQPESTTFSSRWQLVQNLNQSFWKRWSSEYIHNLQQRKKWANRTSNMQPGDLVLVKEDNVPPGRWLMGRVTQIIQGTDGLVRVVMLKTKNGIIKRSIHKLVVLIPPELE